MCVRQTIQNMNTGKKVTTIWLVCKVIITMTCTFVIRSCIRYRHDSARDLHLSGEKKKLKP
jgi:NADH:ubiquinone oxidoreductase subunit H